MKNDVVIIKINGLLSMIPILTVNNEFKISNIRVLDDVWFFLTNLNIKVNGERYITPINIAAMNPDDIAPNSELPAILYPVSDIDNIPNNG